MSEVTELDAESTEVLATVQKRGTWHNLTTFRRNQPHKCKFIQWLLGKGATVKEVCALAEVSATTVCQILKDPELGPPIAEQKAHITNQTRMALRVGMEATVTAWTAPDAKPPDVFHLKLLRDMVAMDEGTATVRVEHTHTFLAPDTSATMRLLEANVVATPAITDGQKVSTGIGSDSRIIHALAEVAASPGEPEVIGECEEMRADTEPPDVTPSV